MSRFGIFSQQSTTTRTGTSRGSSAASAATSASSQIDSFRWIVAAMALGMLAAGLFL